MGLIGGRALGAASDTSPGFPRTLAEGDAEDDPPGFLGAAVCKLGGAIDHMALRGMSLVYGRLLDQQNVAPSNASGCAIPRRVESTTEFFSFLERGRPLELLEDSTVARLPGGVIIDLRFRSPYDAFDEGRGRIRAEWVENGTIHVSHWKHVDGVKRPTVLLLHGFGMGSVPWFDARVLCAPQWFARGVDVALLTLPLHGSRCPRGVPYSGAAFGSWDVAHLNESVRESVHDIDGVLRHLAAASDAPVGLIGFSLGGYLAALMAELSTRPAFVVPIMAPVFLGDLPGRLYSLLGGGRVAPLSDAELDRGYKVHSPLQRPLAISRERVMIVGGRSDAFVPPAHPRALWQHWGRPRLHWLNGGHLTPFGRGRLVDAIGAEFAHLGFGGA